MNSLRISLLAFVVATAMAADSPPPAPLPIVRDVDWQPLAAQIGRLLQAMEVIGEPCPPAEKRALEAALLAKDASRVQAVLDARCLFGVHLQPAAAGGPAPKGGSDGITVVVRPGPAKRELVEQGWRSFLVKVHNEAGAATVLRAVSPNAVEVYERNPKLYERLKKDLPPSELHYRDWNVPADAAALWLDVSMFEQPPLTPKLGGLALEYRILQLYSRDAGGRAARFTFMAGESAEAQGPLTQAEVRFECLPAHSIALRVKDEEGAPTTASFVIRDGQGRVYPYMSKRLEPDFFFQPQVYRRDGESVRLPAGRYTIEMMRGPESVLQKQSLTVPAEREIAFKVERWIDPSKFGWWSGDHHIHAAGCKHYVRPTEGVLPAAMMRHVEGEDLKVGANLTWGPGFDYQKQFFCGKVDGVSTYPYLLRYDIEVSGFGSHRSGHLVLLRLQEQIYPGGNSKDHWPTLGLNTLRWAKRQGAVCGPAHSGGGLIVDSTELPNYIIPPYDGIGANEYIVDITHELPGPDGKLGPALDFISTVDTNIYAELNMWYHTLNAGFRVRASGETDFPCMSDERVGRGRSYVKLDGMLDYDQWCEGIRLGRAYVSDGKGHLLDFSVNDAVMGEKGSELRMGAPGRVRARVKAAAMLDEITARANRYSWNLERARIGQSREVPVEIVVNGFPVAKKNLTADGTLRDLEFDVNIERSSWVAVRIFGSAHTNPIFVVVGDKPIRASRRSVEWCLKGVDQCWKQKEQFIAAAEMADAKAAYEHARQVYRARLRECEVD